jgi:hypothetical protein
MRGAIAGQRHFEAEDLIRLCHPEFTGARTRRHHLRRRDQTSESCAMRIIRNTGPKSVKLKSVARHGAVLFAAVMLSAAAGHASWAAGRTAAGVHHGGHFHGRMNAPLFDQGPVTPPPILNESSPYTVPQAPETPVSPASPGSVFGNGPGGY